MFYTKIGCENLKRAGSNVQHNLAHDRRGRLTAASQHDMMSATPAIKYPHLVPGIKYSDQRLKTEHTRSKLTCIN